MTTLASLKELYTLGFIQDVEYIARLALLGIYDPTINGDVLTEADHVLPKPEEPVIESVETSPVIESVETSPIEEPAFVPVTEPKTVAVQEVPVQVLPSRRVPQKPRRPKTRKLLTKRKVLPRWRRPIVRRWRSRSYTVREQNVHLADSISEKDRRRERYLKSVHQRQKKLNREIVRNFRAAKKWAATKHDRPSKIRKPPVDGAESIQFHASVVKKNAFLYNQRKALNDRNIWFHRFVREVAKLNEQAEPT